MLKNHIVEQLIANLKFEPTGGQREIIELISEFILDENDHSLLLIKGFAGTGKTTLVNSIVKTLKNFQLKTNLLAPTGRAAKVLTSYTKKTAYTIHKKIYRQKSSTDGFGKFTLDLNPYKDTIFIVDEASMISNSSMEMSMFGTGRLLDDLIQYVYNDRNCKLILIGDTAQLPPVRLDISPALDSYYLEQYGLNVYSYELTEVVRQADDSGILSNATQIRENIAEFYNDYPKFEIENFPDIENLSGEDLIDTISDSYDKVGEDETIIVCRSNKRANIYNQGVRGKILWREEEICQGDQLMVVKNNYKYVPDIKHVDFVANGDIVQIKRIRGYQEEYGFRFADVVLCLADYEEHEMDAKILLDTLMYEGPSLNKEDNMKLFNAVQEDYMDIRNKKQRFEKLREDKFLNALQVKYAYAVTCHKAQGGQWKHVYIDQGYFIDDMLDVEYLRWLYTAFTRATENLYLVNFKKDFFE